jgi:hypothetical protein
MPRGPSSRPSRDPLFYETVATLPVDFHSFRRAFNAALAEAGVNVQHAMTLASHSDPRTHMRYVMETTAMRRIPDAAVPSLPAMLPEIRPQGDGETGDGARIVTASNDSPPLPVVPAEILSDFSGRSRD